MIHINKITADTIAVEIPPPPSGRLTVKAKLSDGTELPIEVLSDLIGLEDSYPLGTTAELTLQPHNIGETEQKYTLISWSNGDTTLSTEVEITETTQEIFATFDAGPLTRNVLSSWEGQEISGDYVLMEDIDFQGATWAGVAKFTGSFNGNGHTISGFKLKMGEYQGFFLKLEDAIIQNLTIDCEGFDESSAPEDFDGSFGGAVLVGRTYSKVGAPVRILDVTTKGLICGDQGTPTCHNSAGMLALADYTGTRTLPMYNIEEYIGKNGLAIIRCDNQVHVYDTRASGLKFGGLVGYCNSDVVMTDSVNSGTLTTTTNLLAGENVGVGGLIGNTGSAIANQFTIIHDCKSDCLIDCPAGSTGITEVCGWIRNGTINGIRTKGMIGALANLGSEIGWSGVGIKEIIAIDNNGPDHVSNNVIYRLLNPNESPEFNTDKVYKYLVTSDCGLGLPAAPSGTYIFLDCSVAKPTVKFNNVVATEEATSDPNIFKFIAA